MRPAPRLPVIALTLAWTLLPSEGRAHAPAKGVDLVWASPDADMPSVVVSNRGLVLADEEQGEPVFSLRCNEALSVSVSQPPSVLTREDGSLLVSAFHGAYVSRDHACTLEPASGLPDVSLSPAVQTENGPVLSTRATDGTAQVFSSTDEGANWTERYANLSSDYFRRLRVAPSEPSTLYAQGVRLGVAGSATCAVSNDSGETWTVHTLASNITPFAVHPAQPSTVFAYEPIDDLGTRYRILRSQDGCASFEPVLDNMLLPTSVAYVSGTLFLGVDAGGLFRSDDEGASFERVLADQINSVTCLDQRGDRLWICANLAPNTNGVWYSDDGASSLTPFMRFEDVSQPVACDDPADRVVCAGPWYDFYSELHVTPDAGVDAAVPDAGSMVVDAGMPEPPDPDPGSSQDAAVPVDAGIEPAPGSDGGPGGGCAASAAQTHRGAWAAIFALALLHFSARRARAGRAG